MIVGTTVSGNRVGIFQEGCKLHKKVSDRGRVEILFITKLFISTKKTKQLYYVLC